MGNNSTQKVVGKRKIKMKLIMRENTIFVMLNDVIFVPSLTKKRFKPLLCE
jgi:hypothetical protein